MSLGLALVAVLIVALRGRLARFRPRPGGLRSGGRLHSLPVYHGAYAALWARAPGVAVPRRLGADPVADWSIRRCSRAPRPGASRFDMQRAGDPGRSARDRCTASASRASIRNPPRWRRASATPSSATRCIGGVAAILRRAWRGRRWPFAAARPQFRARTGVERWVMVAAVRRLADRDPDDARHPPVADVREPALLPARTRSIVPVRHSNGARRPRFAPTRRARRARSARSRCSGAPSSSARSSR